MQSQHTDDTHVRWVTQADAEKSIWENSNQVIAPQILNSALEQKEPPPLCRIYQALSMERARCEFRKNPTNDKFSPIKKEYFGALALSGVPSINSSKQWGKFVTDFIKERQLNHSNRCGLSNHRMYSRLDHPAESDADLVFILNKIDLFFQPFTATNHFFHFLQLAARIIYDLSNFPPIVRGSAAVNSQIIDIIAKRNFNITSSIRPILYDWVAFYETPEQYSAYYIISATAKYLETIPYFKNRHQKFFESLPSHMLKNPNIKENQLQRKKIWYTLKHYIHEALKQSKKLNPGHASCLQSFMNAELIFRTPSQSIVNLVNALKEHDQPVEQPREDSCYFHDTKLSQEQLLNIINEAGCELQDLQRLFHFHYNTTDCYLQNYGKLEVEEAMQQDWADIELLRTLDIFRFNWYLYSLKKILFPDLLEKNFRPSPESQYGIISLSFDPTTAVPDALLTLTNHKPTYAYYRNAEKIFWIENDGSLNLVKFKDNLGVVLIKSDQEIYQKISVLFPKIQDTLYPLEGDLWKITRYDTSSFRFHKTIDTLRMCSHATWNNIAKLSVETLKLLASDYPHDDPKRALQERILEGIWSGGFVLQDLIDLTLDQIYQIADPKAIALYQKNKFIRFIDILQSTSYDALEEKTKDSIHHFKGTLFQHKSNDFYLETKKTEKNEVRTHHFCRCM